jgi:hypothetical protein
VPPKGAPTSSLLERYCSVLGVDAGTLDPRSGEANVGLGTTQVELLRQINLKLSPEFTWRSYDRLVKHGIALGPLAAGQGTEKVSLPSSAFPVVAARTERMLAWIRDAGYAVVGDLADLLVRHPEPVVSRPTEAEPEESADALLEAGSTTIAHLLQRLDAAYALIEQQAEPPVQRQAEPEGAGPEEAAPEAAAPEATTDGDVPSAPTQAAQSVIGPARPRHDPRRPGQHTAFVFVGPPKVGLDCLQSQLATHSHALADQGVRVAGSSAEDRWRAAAGLVPEEFPRARWDGGRAAWDALAEEVRGRKGTWLVAHDLLAGASEAEARKALAALAPAEVHVVAVVRGVDRQLPAEWLEHVRGGGRQAFEHFLNAAVVDAERSPHRTWFWHVQDVVEVLNRWAADLPGNRVHVITGTAGPEGTRTTWQRLCAVLGVDPARLPLPEDASRLEPRPSGAEVLRQLNQVLSRRTQEVAGRPHLTTAYSRVLAHNLLSGLLADSPEGSGVVLPPELHGWARHRTEATMAAIAQAGYDVVGDLDELEPEPIRLDVVPPGRVPDRQLLTTALELLASVTERMLSGPEGMTTRQFAGYAVRRVSEPPGADSDGAADCRKWTDRAEPIPWWAARAPDRRVFHT